MGGFFSPTEIKPTVVPRITPEDRPFAERIKAGIGQIGDQPFGISLPEQVVWGQLLGGGTGAVDTISRLAGGNIGPVGGAIRAGVLGAGVQGLDPLAATLRGEFLDQQSPYTQALRQRILSEAEEAKRRFAGAAAKAGALASSDFVKGMAGLEAQTAARLGELAHEAWERERQRQLAAAGVLGDLARTLTGTAMLPEEVAMRAAGILPPLGSWLLGTAGLPRELAERGTILPIQLGLQYLGAVGGTPMLPQYAPSPFAQLLGGLGSLIGAGIIKF